MLAKLTILTLLLYGVSVSADEANPDTYVRRRFQINVSIVSYLPDGGIESYKSGSGMAEEGASLGLGCRFDGVSSMINMKPFRKSGRFIVPIDMRPTEAKKAIGFSEQRLDMTDLKPLAIEIGKDKSGRVYQLNLTPSVKITDSTPRRFDANKLRLHDFSFSNSPILLNDSQYVGRLGSSGGAIAYFDISGVAKVEFSLYHLVGWEPWGVLAKGVLAIVHPEQKTNIQISNVLNGRPRAELQGGPYRVWVRWSEPSETVEQHRQSLIQLRKRLQNSDTSAVRLRLLDKQIARPPGPWLGSSGVHSGIGKNEIVPEEDETGTP